MNSVFEAKLSMPRDVVAPDVFYPDSGPTPNDDFIVSRDLRGQPKSRFGHLVWDFSAYNSTGKVGKLYFNFWGAGQPTSTQLMLTVEMRRVIFCLIWRRAGAPLSIGTLKNYLMVLAALANYADGLQIGLGTVLEDEVRLQDFVTSRCGGWMAETLTSLLPHLAQLGLVALGFGVVSDQFIEGLNEQNKAYREGLKQHPPMPSRIYSRFISGLQVELSKWRAVSKKLLDAARYCSSDPRAGRTLSGQDQAGRKHKLPFKEFLTLEEILDEETIAYVQAQGKPVEVQSLPFIIGQAQYIAKLTIQTFSGMRDDEVKTLPYDCQHISESGGARHFLVRGVTTKYAHGLAKRAQWVTNKEGNDAIQVAKDIADAIYDGHDVTPEVALDRISDHPLFVSVAYFGFGITKREPKNGHFLPGIMAHRKLPESCVSIIEENDLRELEQIDPHRAWRAEDQFQIGKPWMFTSHQTRRSLALYAQRSGLVSLPSLRRQLKHITDEMSRYYAKGSAFAKDFIGNDKRHFGLEWQSTQAESSALSYILNVLMSDDVLFGGHAHWIHQRMKKPDGVVFMDRGETLRRFRKGEIAYQETILGGCTNLGTCEKVAVRWLHTACVIDNCRNLVGNMSKLDLVISAQQKLIERLDANSVEYRTELRDLQTLIETRERTRSTQRSVA